MVTKLEGTPAEVAAWLNAVLSDQTNRQRKHAVALVMINDDTAAPLTSPSPEEFTRLMSEAAADTVSVGHMDDSREAMYTRMEGE